MNQAVGEKNRLDTSVGRKWLVRHFTREKFWKYTGFIILAVTFGVKVHPLCGKLESYVSKKGQTTLRTPLHRYVYCKTDLLKARCYLNCPHYCYDLH